MIINLFRILILSNIFLISSSTFSQTFDIEFTDGLHEKVKFNNNNYLSGNKQYFFFDIISFRGGINEPNGPFAIDFTYLKYNKSMNNAIEFKYYFTPLDFILMEGFDGYKAYPMSIDFNYQKVLGGYDKYKIKRLNLAIKDNIFSRTLYYAKLPIKQRVNFYLRLGGFFNQYTWAQNYNLVDGSVLNLDAVKTYSIYCGINRKILGYLDFQTLTLGSNNFSFTKEIYFDIFYAPIMYGLGSVFKYDNINYQNILLADKHISDYTSQLNAYKTGFRIGMMRSVKILSTKKTMSYIRGEFAYYPGYEWQFYYFLFGIGLGFGN